MTESLGRWRQSLEWCFGVFVHLTFLTSFTRLCPSGKLLSDSLPPVGALDECHTSLDSRVGNAMESVTLSHSHSHSTCHTHTQPSLVWSWTSMYDGVWSTSAVPGRTPGRHEPLKAWAKRYHLSDPARRWRYMPRLTRRSQQCWGRNIAVGSARNTACRRIRRNCHRVRHLWIIRFVSMTLWYLVRHNAGLNRTTNNAGVWSCLFWRSRHRWSWRRNVSSTSASSCIAWDHPSSGRMSYSSEAETAATIPIATSFSFGFNWTRDKASVTPFLSLFR